MNKIFKNIWLSFLSVSLVVLSVYWAWTIITNLTQTATTWDKISSQWVNAVNTWINNANAATWEWVSCVSTNDSHNFIVCIWNDWTCRKWTLSTSYQIFWWNCANAK